MNYNLTQNISDLIPKSLDNIVRKNRESVELGLATGAVIQGLERELGNVNHFKDVIDDWRLICLREKKTDWTQVMLLGFSTKNNCVWITSTVIAIDFSQNAVSTHSGSLYQLGKAGQGEPPTGHLLHVCAALHRWGSGSLLGAPEYFY